MDNSLVLLTMTGARKMRRKKDAVDATMHDSKVHGTSREFFRRYHGVNAARLNCGSNFRLKFACRLKSVSARAGGAFGYLY